MSPYNELPERMAMEKLAEHTTDIIKRIQQFAVSYNVNIIAGSMPLLERASSIMSAIYVTETGVWIPLEKSISRLMR